MAEGLPSRWRQSAYGVVPDKDGSVLVAQEDYDAVLKTRILYVSSGGALAAFGVKGPGMLGAMAVAASC